MRSRQLLSHAGHSLPFRAFILLLPFCSLQPRRLTSRLNGFVMGSTLHKSGILRFNK